MENKVVSEYEYAKAYAPYPPVSSKTQYKKTPAPFPTSSGEEYFLFLCAFVLSLPDFS
jgi:hypothetical protein